MNPSSAITRIAAVIAVPLSLAVVSTALAGPSGPAVTVRVENHSGELVKTTPVTLSAGWVTRDRAPSGKCPATSAAGALEGATRGQWSGSWSKKYNDYFLQTIAGDTESGTKTYWELFVNNVAAQSGICETKLKAGDALLFAAVPTKGYEYPIGIRAKHAMSRSAPMIVDVVYYNAKGKPAPLKGAHVTLTGANPVTERATAKTIANGTVEFRPSFSGQAQINVSDRGYVAPAPFAVRILP